MECYNSATGDSYSRNAVVFKHTEVRAKKVVSDTCNWVSPLLGYIARPICVWIVTSDYTAQTFFYQYVYHINYCHNSSRKLKHNAYIVACNMSYLGTHYIVIQKYYSWISRWDDYCGRYVCVYVCVWGIVRSSNASLTSRLKLVKVERK